MPLVHGHSAAVIQQNIKEMVAAGHPQDQAVAASMRIADQSRKEACPHCHGTGKKHK